MNDWSQKTSCISIEDKIGIIIQEVPMKVLVSEEMECLIFFTWKTNQIVASGTSSAWLDISQNGYYQARDLQDSTSNSYFTIKGVVLQIVCLYNGKSSVCHYLMSVLAQRFFLVFSLILRFDYPGIHHIKLFISLKSKIAADWEMGEDNNWIDEGSKKAGGLLILSRLSNFLFL